MKRYRLGTKMVGYLIRGHPAVVRRVVAAPMAALQKFLKRVDLKSSDLTTLNLEDWTS